MLPSILPVKLIKRIRLSFILRLTQFPPVENEIR
jgi:hypothetical protein